jgi:hypothetical protein
VSPEGPPLFLSSNYRISNPECARSGLRFSKLQHVGQIVVRRGDHFLECVIHAALISAAPFLAVYLHNHGEIVGIVDFGGRYESGSEYNFGVKVRALRRTSASKNTILYGGFSRLLCRAFDRLEFSCDVFSRENRRILRRMLGIRTRWNAGNRGIVVRRVKKNHR